MKKIEFVCSMIDIGRNYEQGKIDLNVAIHYGMENINKYLKDPLHWNE